MVDDVADFATGAREALSEIVECVFVGEVECDVVELHGTRVGHAGRFRERFDGGVGVFEERDGALRSELEEVVAEFGSGDRGDESGSERSVVEADGGVHVRGDEREVVDSSPAWCGRFDGRGHGDGHFRDPFVVARLGRFARWRAAACGAGVDCASSAACWSFAMSRRSSRCSLVESAAHDHLAFAGVQ